MQRRGGGVGVVGSAARDGAEPVTRPVRTRRGSTAAAGPVAHGGVAAGSGAGVDEGNHTIPRGEVDNRSCGDVKRNFVRGCCFSTTFVELWNAPFPAAQAQRRAAP